MPTDPTLGSGALKRPVLAATAGVLLAGFALIALL
jgi:hypothetical protein